MDFRWLPPIILLALLAAMPARAQQVSFTPEAGLSGPSRGSGSLKLLLGPSRAFQVRSLGRTESDGTFTLQQTVSFEGKEPATRAWVVRTLAPLRYSGTLTDAAGPVSGHAVGPRLFLKYRVKGPLVMHQVLHLLPDGRTIDNVGRITFLGVPVGHLRETIRRGE